MNFMAGRAVIVELGCGLRKHPKAIGVDKNPKFNPDVLWDLDDFPYPFKDGQADKILCKEVLEHLRYPERVLNEIWRILKSGGRLILTTPNRDSLINRMFKTYEVSAHISLQTIDSLWKMVSKKFWIIRIYLLPYDDQYRHDLKYRDFRLLRQALHKTLPQSLQERIVMIAMKM